MRRELHHGGRLHEVAERYAIPLGEWLDLSTGINPHAWPVPPLPVDCWQRLPEEEDGLLDVAAAYYGTAQLLPLAGSQAAIQLLPQLRSRSCVGIPHPAYAEHAYRWQQAGHEVIPLGVESIDTALPDLDVLLLVNPNNPDGSRFSRDQLLAWQRQLTARGGWLVVDEAFIDAAPEQSIIDAAGSEGLVVLRSLGKFFGLAGARVGFVAAWPALLAELRHRLGPWSLAGPSRVVARLALADRNWQGAMRLRLQAESERLANLLNIYGLSLAGGSALFQYCRHPEAERLAEQFARRGILLRTFQEPSALRFGLPADEAGWQRLEAALDECSAEVTGRQFGLHCSG